MASLHFPVSPGKIAAALVRAKQTFDASRDYAAVWKYAVLDQAILD